MKRYLVFAPLLVLQVFLPTVSASMARTLSWSGYQWDVRPPGTGEPGPNAWSNSAANVQVSGSDLLLSIVQDSFGTWTSSEVDNQRHLGYGTYRWVVASDLSALDANEVLGMFTYGGSSPSNNEIDIEPSHWGNKLWPTGSATVWQNAAANQSREKSFNYSNRPPYVNQFTWSPGRVSFLITDATGAVLLKWTLTSGVPTPSTEVPVINYWRFNNVAPATVRTMRISSFSWAPLGQKLPTVGGGGATGSTVTRPHLVAGPPGVSGTTAGQLSPGGRSLARTEPGNAAWTCTIGGRTQAQVLIALRSRWVTGGRRRWLIRWTATGAGSVRLVLARLVHASRYAVVWSVTRIVDRGSGNTRSPSKLGKRSLRPGVYDISVTARASHVRCTPQRLRFTLFD